MSVIEIFVYNKRLEGEFDNACLGHKIKVISSKIRGKNTKVVKCEIPNVNTFRAIRDDFEAITGLPLCVEWKY